ncbi:alpha/beta hydrolase family protein [Pseudomonas phenolilytica]|uniref:alpha/beta hydrolase family protein n=1 Tax=Pseudomonas phenolilytica TaxID=2746321 RepID=UPI001F344BF0|nr:prolyl oligopeptidase family serine peptidase [Pseudomonas phenolilytica]UIP87765.1 S9 family peptidase [Pseudomonas phenolilytica]
MSERATVPYGFWPSDWSAESAAAACGDFTELRAGHNGLFWIAYDPGEARCSLWYWRDGGARCLTPAGYSLRSRVYEYGGGAFCLTAQGIAFVNEADQQIHLQTLTAEGSPSPPTPLTANGAGRYGALHFDSCSAAILAVEEDHAQQPVRHRIVSIDLADGARRVVAEGADFYSSPVTNRQGDRLAWIQWSRPEQPWTFTSLWLAERGADGVWGAPHCVAGTEGEEALQQPRFCALGELYCLSDRAGGWQPWRERAGRLQPLELDMAADVDCAPAPWELATCSYLPLANGGMLLTRMSDGQGLLFEYADTGRVRQLANDFSRCRQLTADDHHFYCIVGSPAHTPAVLAIARDSGSVRILAGGVRPLPDDELARPQSLYFATGAAASERAHAFFYPPCNAHCIGPDGVRPPLLVFVHGGPTSACYPVFDPRIQFWTQRGFAVVDVNYRGSSGFGRAYRMRLREQWGVLDVEDACQVVDALARRGWIDATRAFIRGSSAGGYTALCALAADSRWRGGASLYGVSDPLALRRGTHKFEGDYLDWLIGDPYQVPQRFQQRAPLHNAGRIEAPVIFFQGGRDAVVLPGQTESMVAALRARGVPVEYRLYPEERHGFRQARHLADALTGEWRFYQRLL